MFMFIPTFKSNSLKFLKCVSSTTFELYTIHETVQVTGIVTVASEKTTVCCNNSQDTDIVSITDSDVVKTGAARSIVHHLVIGNSLKSEPFERQAGNCIFCRTTTAQPATEFQKVALALHQTIDLALADTADPISTYAFVVWFTARCPVFFLFR